MIRFATEKDIPKIGDLLCQVCLVHHKGRPDIFNVGRKYSDAELLALLSDPNRPILVAVDEADEVQGYCFCVYQQPDEGGALKPNKTLYIDDLCVDETLRGQHIGRTLYESLTVGVLDTKDKCTVLVLRDKVGVERCTKVADMHIACGAGGKSCYYHN